MIPLSEILPHKDPMILLSGYEEPLEDHALTTWVTISEASPFYEVGIDGVPGCVALEYMAQSMALRVGLLRRQAGLPPQLGFVLGSRRLEIKIPVFKCGERYGVHVACTYQDEEFGSFDCEIRDAKGEVVARGTVTAFQPSGDVSDEKLKEYT